MTLPRHAQIIEVGLRDGLQNEPTFVPTETKLALIKQLVSAGLKKIQVASFVHPKLVPQMADAEAVCAGLTQTDGVSFSGLVLNAKGVERAAKAGLQEVDMSISASDTHSRKNANCSLPEAIDRFAEMVSLARQYGLRVRGGIQCAFGCAYEGNIPADKVIALAKQHLALGLDELALADSTGMANPIQIKKMGQALKPLLGDIPLVLHLHDTRGLGLANVMAALEAGITHFDTAFGGLGGCPFIKGATGNIATEDTLYLLEEIGVQTGINRQAVAQCSHQIAEIFKRELPGKLYRLNA